MKLSITHITALAFALGLSGLNTSCQTLNESRTPTAGTFQRSGEVRLALSTSKKRYAIGDTLHFSVTPSKDVYLAAWIRGVDGRTHRIYPNKHESGRLFSAGVRAHFPGNGDFRFRVTSPTGKDTLIVIASTTPISCATPPSRNTWIKGIEVDAMNAEMRGEARVVYEVVK